MDSLVRLSLNQTLDDALSASAVESSHWLWADLLQSLVEKATKVQTLIFDKSKFSRDQATAWATSHGFRADKVDETANSYRLRQRDPNEFQEGSFRTIAITAGVKAVIGRPKPS